MATIPNMAPATVPAVFHTTMLLVQAWRLSPSIGCLFLVVPAAYTISPPPLLTVVTPPRPSLEQQASSYTPSVEEGAEELSRRVIQLEEMSRRMAHLKRS